MRLETLHTTYRQDQEGRWYRRDQQGIYTNYYIQGNLSEDRYRGYYNTITEQRWNDETTEEMETS